MIQNRDEYVFKKVKEHLNFIKTKYPQYEVIFIGLQGSQNYDLDIYTEEYTSDVDTKAIIVPTLKQIALNKQPVSKTVLIPTYKQIKEYKMEFGYVDDNNCPQCGVYCLQNITKNKFYIGSSKTRLIERMKDHLHHIKNMYHPNPYIQKDIELKDKFDIFILEFCSEQNYLSREQHWIDYFGGINSNNVYNQMSTDGKNKTKEYLDKISKANKGKVITDEQRKIISQKLIGNTNSKGEKNGMYGKHHTEDAKAKMSSYMKQRIEREGHPKGMLGKEPWNKGIPRSEETKLKISETKKNNPNKPFLGKHHTEEAKRKISQSNKGVPGKMKDTVFVNNGLKNFRIPRTELDNYLKNGYEKGMRKRSKK